MGFFPSLHIYKNLPRITVLKKLKCPDPSMIPLPAEVKECSQKSILGFHPRDFCPDTISY